MAISDEDLQRVVEALDQLGQAARNLTPKNTAVSKRIEAHLGVDPATLSAITRPLQNVDRPNLQLALNEIVAAQPDASLIGLSPELAYFPEASLSGLIAGRAHGPTDEVPPVYTDLAVDVDQTLPCVVAGLWLLEHEGVPVVVGLLPGGRHGPNESPRIEFFAADQSVGVAFVDHLERLRDRHNVYRGKVLAFSFSEYGDFGVTFTARPDVQAADVILPVADFTSIERHTIGVEQRAEQLRGAGQHLKRGLLLHGPPGSGKTHTVSYLMAAMPERTVVILQGPSIGALGQGAAIVRSLAPSMLVIEDVDLIAADRGMMGPGPDQGHPLLFQLLNEMDGFVASDDVLFVLTTNRREILEEALANRPGRIDHAVKIDLPDREGRERLLDLYLAGTSHEIEDRIGIIERIDGVTASFVKELIRRATLCSLEELDGDSSATVKITDAHLHMAIDELKQYMPTASPDPMPPGPPGPDMPPGMRGVTSITTRLEG